MAMLTKRFGPLNPSFYPRPGDSWERPGLEPYTQGSWRRRPQSLLGTNGQLPARFGPLAPQFYAPTPVVPGLGDLFNDIVGSIVPGWDDRPQWMKDIKVTVKPDDVANFAKRVFPKQAAAVEKAVKQVGQQAAPYAKEWAAWYARRKAQQAGEQFMEFAGSPMGMGVGVVIVLVLGIAIMRPGAPARKKR